MSRWGAEAFDQRAGFSRGCAIFSREDLPNGFSVEITT